MKQPIPSTAAVGRRTPRLKEALGNKAVKRSLHADLFQMDVLGAD
jgi:hypothetical protein